MNLNLFCFQTESVTFLLEGTDSNMDQGRAPAPTQKHLIINTLADSLSFINPNETDFQTQKLGASSIPQKPPKNIHLRNKLWVIMSSQPTFPDCIMHQLWLIMCRQSTPIHTSPVVPSFPTSKARFRKHPIVRHGAYVRNFVRSLEENVVSVEETAVLFP
jgi:hypothetical protein